MRRRYRYTVAFTGPLLDDDEVTEALAQLGVTVESVSRAALPRPAQVVLTATEQTVIDLLSDGQAHRMAGIRARLTEVHGPSKRWPHLVFDMLELELIQKVRHGVYASIDVDLDADLPIPPANNQVERPSEDRLLELLGVQPRSAVELRHELGVSRQRVDQLLKKLEAAGTVTRQRVAGELAPYLYAIAGRHSLPHHIATRQPMLGKAKARVLSHLRPDLLTTARALVEALPSYHHVVNKALEDLEARGLATVFKLGAQRYATLTPRGAEHPQYVPDKHPCPPADVIGIFGKIRSTFLQLLHVGGEMRTIDLTYASPPGLFEGATRTSGMYVQDLEDEGLVEPATSGPGHARYQLTRRGVVAASLIDRVRPPPEPSLIQERIRERRRARGFTSEAA